MELSIVIVNYKSKGLTLNCLKAIDEADFNGLEHEVIVVDNNSGDQLGEIITWQYPRVTFIQSNVNRGMGAGNNIGIKQARGRYVVIMNPDTLPFADTFLKLYLFMEQHRRVGIVGPQQFNPDQTIQVSRYRFPTVLALLSRRTFLGRLKIGKKAANRFLMQDSDFSATQSVDWLLGSCLCIRAQALKEVGLFDEQFFLYFEDTDLCRRFWQKNWQVVYYPEARIIHNHNRASANYPWYTFFLNRASRYHLVSWLRYVWKWLGHPSTRD